MYQVLQLLRRIIRDVRDGSDARQGVTMLAIDVRRSDHQQAEEVAECLESMGKLPRYLFGEVALGNLEWALRVLSDRKPEPAFAHPPNDHESEEGERDMEM